MADELRLSLIQMRAETDARDANVARACAEIDRLCTAEDGPPDLIVLPELFNTEYFPQHRDWSYVRYAEPVDGPTMTAIRERAVRHRTSIVAPIYELASPGHLYDSAIAVGPEGEILATYRKAHPAAMESVEKLYFRPGSKFPVFTLPNGWRVGMIICYDTYFPESARSVALHGAELLVIPFAGGTAHRWYDLMAVRAFENLLFLAACNKVGVEDRQPFGGRSCVFDPFGEMLVTASGDREESISTTLDRSQIWQARTRYSMYRDRRPDLYRALVTDAEDLHG
ncbi:MAG: carbon-nitrogen hydrolase family protein [Chloroflexota bacterium]